LTRRRRHPASTLFPYTTLFRSEIVTMGEGGPLGDSWMMPALVRPVRYDPGHKRFLVLKRMTLRVEFAAATTAQLKVRPAVRPGADRKSTRLNSSHVSISYAVFC